MNVMWSQIPHQVFLKIKENKKQNHNPANNKHIPQRHTNKKNNLICWNLLKDIKMREELKNQSELEKLKN